MTRTLKLGGAVQKHSVYGARLCPQDPSQVSILARHGSMGTFCDGAAVRKGAEKCSAQTYFVSGWAGSAGLSSSSSLRVAGP